MIAAQGNASSSSARSRSPPESHTALPAQLRAWLGGWARGTKTASEVVRDAQAAAQDSRPRDLDPRIVRLARSHNNLGNAERLVEQLAQGAMLPPVPCQVPDSLVEWVLSPYDLFHWMRTTNARLFREHLGARPGRVEEWWARFLQRPACAAFWAAHPWLRTKSPADLKRHLPLMMFDDAGPVSKHASTYARMWYSLLGTGGDREARFLINTGLKNAKLTDRSWPMVLQSFERLAEPVADGSWGGVLLFFGGDLDYVCNLLGLPHFSSNEVCCECRANISTMPHNNFNAEAAWRPTVVTNEEFRARLRRPLHPLVEHPVFSKYTFRYDLLHMLDHHGVASHVVANILWAHVSGDRESEALPGDNEGERIEFLSSDMRAFYTQHQVANRMPALKLSNLKAGDYPELKGNAVKAANTRALAPYALEVQRRATEMSGTVYNRHMLKVAESLQAVYDLLYNSDFFWTRPASPAWTAIAPGSGRTTRCVRFWPATLGGRVGALCQSCTTCVRIWPRKRL